MKPVALAALLLSAFLFSQCKTSQPASPTADGPSLLQVCVLQDSTSTMFLQMADSTNGDPRKALELTAEWVKRQPSVAKSESLDSATIFIRMTSGLTASFGYDEMDPTGTSLFRGGSYAAGGRLTAFGKKSELTIKNKKVLIYSPVTSQFYGANDLGTYANIFDESGIGLDVTVLEREACTWQMVDKFREYGLVIIETHGSPFSFMIGTSFDINPLPATEADLKAMVDRLGGAGTYDKLVSGELSMGARRRINTMLPQWQKNSGLSTTVNLAVTSKYIRALPPMPETVIFGNMCYSGTADTWFEGLGIRTAFVEKDLISYYAYSFDNGISHPVDNLFAREMETAFAHRLATNRDSTGVAHLTSNGSEYSDPKYSLAGQPLYFRHFGSNNYSYASCGDPFTDERDGTVYNTVCIGKLTWMTENLAFNAPGSACYNNISTNCATYGRLYDWNTVMQGAASSEAIPSGVQGICPKGWHVPSFTEFEVLISALGGQQPAGGALKSTTLWDPPNAGATNSSGFTALPGGMGNHVIAAPFNDMGTYGVFWSSTLNTNTNEYFFLGLSKDAASASLQNSGKETLMSCRCVKD
jgi:uncharacterized protein (TIGR02145 family)